ncbi:hypothetical protein EGT74_08405 [Chitinophaga lutea]|uniref:Uncharacterized protein n=1 Tax=Chitinophaga lutea TaxID=2488634 RepID=A0A3N4PXS7_9BACT|nr:hypothetical protein EGT74_08405 [Chitinophaga lutea]
MLAACLLAGNAAYAQEKAREPVKPTPPLIKEDASPSAKQGKTTILKTEPAVTKDEPAQPGYKIRLGDLKPSTREKILRDGSYKNLTREEMEEVRSVVKPALREGDVPPPPPPVIKKDVPPPPPPKVEKAKKTGPPPPPVPPAKQR